MRTRTPDTAFDNLHWPGCVERSAVYYFCTITGSSYRLAILTFVLQRLLIQPIPQGKIKGHGFPCPLQV